MSLESRYRFTGSGTLENLSKSFVVVTNALPSLQAYGTLFILYGTFLPYLVVLYSASAPTSCSSYLVVLWFCNRHLPGTYFLLLSSYQCCGSGSVGSVCFWTSRIHPSTSKHKKKKPLFLLFCDFFDFLSLKKKCNCIFKK
jgi:hypothetical protein